MAADQPASIVFDDVSVRFPRRAAPAIAAFSLDVPAGSDLLLCGPSGSGKSTVLRCLSGVVPHSVTCELSGRVIVGDRATTGLSVLELSDQVAVLGQDPSAAVCLPTVADELAFVLENRNVPPGAIGLRIEDALSWAGASDLRDRRTSELSGGETQRVALAAALIGNPAVLVLDEPTSMLDHSGVRQVRDSLARLRGGTTRILVEHRLDELAGAQGAAGLPSRLCVLDDQGRMVAEGPTSGVLAEHGAGLHRMGCWLPYETELRAVGGLSAVGAAGRPSVGFRPVALRARGIAVGHGNPVLTGIDLDLRSGELVCVVGGNGSGKTSLLLTLAGLLPPIAGTVDGERAAMVFQNPEHQFCAGTVRDEIAHGLGSRSSLIEASLINFRLTGLADQNPFRLSGGEQRRLSLAAITAHDRAVLLADEPTYGLDRADAVATMRQLRALADSGVAVCLASHDLRFAVAYADRLLVVGDGRLLADAPPGELLSRSVFGADGTLQTPPLVALLAADRGWPATRGGLLWLDEATSR